MPEGPYAEFSRADLLDWLTHWSGKPGRARNHVYSNLGVGLLGEAMSMHTGKPFIDLLGEKVLTPLGLTDTTDRLDASRQHRFAQPRDTKGRAVSAWTFDALAGAGCLRSTVRDLAVFARHVLQAVTEGVPGAICEAVTTPKNATATASTTASGTVSTTVLHRAIRRSTMSIVGLGRRGAMTPSAQCHGWMCSRALRTSPAILHASGGTAGSTCAFYLCPERQQALAILSNNGVAASLWGSVKSSWSNPVRQADRCFGTV